MNRKDFESLIELIKEKTGLNEQGISLRMKYHKGQIAQAKSKEVISEKFVEALKREFDILDVEKPVKEYKIEEKISLVKEAGIEPDVNDPNYLISIIKLQAEAILSQQNTIFNLTNPSSKKSA